MKKTSLFLSSLIVFTSMSFAFPQQKAEKKETRKEVKKVPTKKKAEKKDDKATK